MLIISLYVNVDEDVKYAARQMLDHLGLPFEEVTNLCVGEKKDNVLFVPETADIDFETEKNLLNSYSAIIYAGFNPQTAGGETSLPLWNFSTNLSITKLLNHALEPEGLSEDQISFWHKIIVKRGSSSTLMFVVPPIFKFMAHLFSGTKRGTPYFSLLDGYFVSDENGTNNPAKKVLNLPIINIYESLLLNVMRKISDEKNVPLVRKWFHPDNHLMAVCLTHDVDVLSTVTALDVRRAFARRNIPQTIAGTVLAAICAYSKFLNRKTCSHRYSLLFLPLQKVATILMPYLPSWNLDEYCAIENSVGARSTYFMLAEPDEETCRKCPIRLPLLKKAAFFVAENNHEIALHGSCRSFDDADQVAAEKKTLDRALGTQTKGVRQHLLKMKPPVTWINQQKVSLIYDASFGFNQLVGYRAGTCFPFNPWDGSNNKKLDILEIPLILQDRAILGEGNHWTKKSWNICKKLVDTTYRYNGVFTALWHACVSKLTKSQLIPAYRELAKYASKYDPWFATCESIASWWNLRTRTELIKNNDSGLKFNAVSPAPFRGFSIELYLPRNLQDAEILVRNKRLDDDRVLKRDVGLLFSFDLLQGSNSIIVNY
jgi:hypothetical protein